MTFRNYDNKFMEKFNLLFLNTSIKTILSIGYRKESSVSEICYDIRSNYAYILKGILPNLRKLGLTKENKIGRKRIVKLTKNESEVFKRLDEITYIVLGD